jgi:hypothetical protein
MSEDKSFFREVWEYRASKSALIGWCALSAFATLLLGFTWGGWVTQATATRVAQESATAARRELATTICVAKFLREDDAAQELKSLKNVAFWMRGQIIRDGGWTVLPGVDTKITGVADKCAQRLAEMSGPDSYQSGTEDSASTPAVPIPTQVE